MSEYYGIIEILQSITSYSNNDTYDNSYNLAVKRIKPDGAATESSSNRERIVRNPADRSFGI